MNKKILILTGGTGGHVIPAINFGNYLINKGFICTIMLDKRGKRYSDEFKGKIIIIKSSHLSGNIFYKLKSTVNLILGFLKSLPLILKIKPSKCIAFGSYATFSPLLSILILKVFFKTDIFIHEQNSILGKVNLFFLPYVKNIFTNFDKIQNLQSKYKDKTYYVGMPLNQNINLHCQSNEFKKNKYKKTIFLYGGSQGSIPLIKKFLLLIDNIDQIYLSELQIYIQSPVSMHKLLREFLNNKKISYKIKEFYNNIDEILINSNIVFCRAGAGTINDLIKFNLPSIIIPLPNSIHNHQLQNAKYLSEHNAAILMHENNFNIKDNSNILKELLVDKKRIELMKKALGNYSLPDANKEMLSKMLL